MDFLLESLSKIFIFYIPFLFSLSFHEFSHAWVAFKKGDDTAFLMNRMNLNPLSHIDPLGTVILPLMGLLSGWSFIFGWAKPVPVNSQNLKSPKKDMFWIALAGPLSNLILAVLGAFLFALSLILVPKEYLKNISDILNVFIFLNLLLCFFNLLPFHPLDGGKVFERFLPYHINEFLRKNQSVLNILLIVFFIFGGFRFLIVPMMFFHRLLISFFFSLFSLSL